MILRCTIDGLLLEALFHPRTPALIVFDGDESFTLEAVEALFYEVVSATDVELLRLEQAGYRLLRRAEDFETESVQGSPGTCMWKDLSV